LDRFFRGKPNGDFAGGGKIAAQSSLILTTGIDCIERFIKLFDRGFAVEGLFSNGKRVRLGF
jgi:hypothetical protein